MKKLFYSMLAIATMAFALSSCEDVPAPYDDPNANHNSGKTVDENEILSETFASNFGEFNVYTSKGTPWVINYSTATATGYNSSEKTNTESESYLVSPELDLTDVSEAYLTFEYIYRYSSNDGEDKVLITDNFTDDPATAQWVDITGTLTEGNSWDTFYTFAQPIPEAFLGKTGVRVALFFNASSKSSRTWEVKNLKVMKGTPEDIGDDTPDMPTDLTGNGTKENPYTVADANKIIASLGSNTSDEVFIIGKVSSVKEISLEFGNAEYYISDDGTENGQLTVYRGYFLGGDKFTYDSQLKAGDEVIICGQLVNFKGNTPEVTQGNWIYSLNGYAVEKKDPSAVYGTPEGDGSQGNPYNVAGALTFIKTLGTATSNSVYVKGIVVSIDEVNLPNGNATYYISDDEAGTDKLYIYRAKNTGNVNYTAKDEIAVGDEVLLFGPLVNYQSKTPEMTQGGYIVTTTHAEPEPAFTGTHDQPLTIEEAKALGTADAVWVTGYISGYVEGTDFNSGANFLSPQQPSEASVNTNIIISTEYGGTSKELAIPIQLPRGEIRTALNLLSSPGRLGDKVLIYGQLSSYLNTPGVTSPSYVEVTNANQWTETFGTMPAE